MRDIEPDAPLGPLQRLADAVASVVTDRARQLGICLALGATPASVVRDTVRHGILPTIVGLIGGLPLAVGSGYVVRQQLFGVQPTGEFTLLAVAAMMLTVSIGASVVPALRAANLNPATTLRHE